MRNFDEFVKEAGIGTTLLNTGVKFLNSNAGRTALKGAAIGAASGATLSQPDANGKTHRIKDALTGAVTGGAAGAALGGINNMGTVTPQGIKNGLNDAGQKFKNFVPSFGSKETTAFEELDEMVKEANSMLGMKMKMHANMAGMKLKMLPIKIKAKRYAKKHPNEAQNQNSDNQQSQADNSASQEQKFSQ